MSIFTRSLLLVSFILAGNTFYCQDDLLDLLDDKKDEGPVKVFATFKTYRLGNAQTIETVKKKHLDFRISHRFGNIYDKTLPNPINETGQTWVGFDNATDIRTSFDYGVTEDITLGIGRSKMRKIVDGSIKWRILKQTTKFEMPVSLAVFADVGYSHSPMGDIYNGIVKDFETNELHRLNYFTQIIIASKVNDWLSMEILPSYMHQNFIKEDVNPNNSAVAENGFLTVGFGARIKVTKRMSLIGDYFYNVSDFYTNNPGAKNPLSFGVEMETGGHVFSLFFTNASGLIENNYIPYTRDSWQNGQVKFGFSISRVFSL
jgi:hypothetical protein